MSEEKLRADDRTFEKTLNEKLLSATQQHRGDKLDAETKYKLEQKTTFELRVKLEELTKTVQALRQENQELKATNKINEEALIKAEMLEQQMTKQFK